MTGSETKLVYSARVSYNSRVFHDLMAMHVPLGSTVADITYGKGAFWRDIPEGTYEVLATDLDGGIDCRHLPYADESIDCVVFDPPYTGGFFRKDPNQRAFPNQPFQERYCHNEDTPTGSHSHEGVMELYCDGATEAFRILRPKGIFVVKCQDEVENHTQWMTHVDIITEFKKLGFYCRDLFVVVRSTNPHGRRIKRQRHARKNHSYFLVFVKVKDIYGNEHSGKL